MHKQYVHSFTMWHNLPRSFTPKVIHNNDQVQPFLIILRYYNIASPQGSLIKLSRLYSQIDSDKLGIPMQQMGKFVACKGIIQESHNPENQLVIYKMYYTLLLLTHNISIYFPHPKDFHYPNSREESFHTLCSQPSQLFNLTPLHCPFLPARVSRISTSFAFTTFPARTC